MEITSDELRTLQRHLIALVHWVNRLIARQPPLDKSAHPEYQPLPETDSARSRPPESS